MESYFLWIIYYTYIKFLAHTYYQGETCKYIKQSFNIIIIFKHLHVYLRGYLISMGMSYYYFLVVGTHTCQYNIKEYLGIPINL